MLAPGAWAALKYEPGNYAARGNLLLQLDGIRNVGMTKAHDSNAATWVDLAKGNEATFTITDGDASAWAADGYHFAGGAFGILKNTVNPGNVFTIQIVCDMTPSEQTSKYPSLLGAADDKCNFYTYSTGNQVMFKTDGKGDNIGLKSWGGRYLTAMYYEAGKKSFQTATDTAPAKGSNATSVGAQTFCIGSVYKASADNYAKERYLNGTVKAIRIYNKILSATELQTNRELDEARFFNGIPVTNVVVATAVAGLEGNEGGVYAYDENGYTFSAPHKATKDGVDYACTGYTLETWNGETWTKPVFTASTEYAAKDTSAKVRLTWQWQRTSGSKSPDLDPLFNDYVTDGLILHLDGIRNVGKDKAHDYSARQWIDLASGNRVNFGNASGAGVTSEWADDGYVFGGGEIGRLVDTINPGNAFTIQIVCDVDKTASFQKSSYPHYFGENGDKCNLYTYRADDNNKLVFRVRAVSNVSDASINPWTGRQKYITALYDKGKSSVFSTATGSVTAGTTETAVGARAFTIAGIYTGSASDTARFLNGTIKSVRIYNKVLNAAELAKNRAADEARFFGAGESEPNVVVASSVRGVSGDTPDGAYKLPSGGYTFSAPASVTVGEDTYSCAGYTLETWDGAAWGAAETHSGVLAVPLTDTTAKVRLTWQWSHTAGPGYDAAFNDYVTDGLIVHLDGIRNTGAQAVHDSAATTWADLANPGDYARFIIPDADCGWTEDGYYFDGKSSACYAIMNTERTLGAAFTAQAVLDFDCNNSHRINTAWPGIFGTTATDSDYFAMYYNQNNVGDPAVNFKVANTQVRTGGFKSWNGEYVTGLSDGTKSALFQTVAPDLTTNMSWTVGTRTFTFCGGNGGGQGYTTRRFDGIGKAARIYNRALTDAELAQNRAVDEVRFFGRSPAATGDLVVASAVEGLSGDQPNGAYRPAAGYTFTSQTEAVLDGVPYELKGYTLETWNGTEWADAETGTGASVTPDVTTASKRLTWNWVVKSRLTKIKEYDVGDYVTDGLYIFYDGIRNAGATADHDPDATEWVNLGTGGASLNAVFDYASNASAGDGWETDGYHFKYGGKFAKLASDPTIDWKVTIQVVCEAEKSGKPSGEQYPTYFGSTNDYLNVYGFGAVARTFFKIRNNSGDGSGRMELSPGSSWQGKYLNAIWHAGKYQIFQNVVPVETGWYGSWRKWWTAFSGQPFYIGGVYMEGNADYVNERRLSGKIQAIRVYNRSLLDWELEHNRMVDEARFKGNPPECNVTIATKYGDGTGETLAEEVGNYKVEGTHTFSATKVKDANDNLVDVKCYYLETYDENGKWTGKTRRDGSSFTYTEDLGKVRITWAPAPDGLMIIVR